MTTKLSSYDFQITIKLNVSIFLGHQGARGGRAQHAEAQGQGEQVQLRAAGA